MAVGRRAVVVHALAVAAATRQAFMPSLAASTGAPTGRIVAAGDIHGDVHALTEILELSGLWSAASRRWTGGDATFVQVGDVLDRGDDEYRVLELLREVKTAAAEEGGHVITMLGNHEVMNVLGVAAPFVSPRSGGFGEDRAAAFHPGGKLAVEFSSWPVVAVVGTTAFVHAGVTPEIARDAQAVNAAAAAWLRGERGIPPELLTAPGRRSPIWTRHLSNPPDVELARPVCAELGEALQLLKAKRLVVGHTPQEKINCACGSVWRIDLGMSSAMGGGRIEALEIVGDQVRVLTSSGEALPGSTRMAYAPYIPTELVDLA